MCRRVTLDQSGDLLGCPEFAQPPHQPCHSVRVVEGDLRRGVTPDQVGDALSGPVTSPRADINHATSSGSFKRGLGGHAFGEVCKVLAGPGVVQRQKQSSHAGEIVQSDGRRRASGQMGELLVGPDLLRCPQQAVHSVGLVARGMCEGASEQFDALFGGADLAQCLDERRYPPGACRQWILFPGLIRRT